MSLSNKHSTNANFSFSLIPTDINSKKSLKNFLIFFLIYQIDKFDLICGKLWIPDLTADFDGTILKFVAKKYFNLSYRLLLHLSLYDPNNNP